MAIIRGTTPILRFTFKEVNVNNITDAFLIIKRDQTNIIEKSIDEVAARTETTLDWKLSQQETLSLPEGMIVDICCDWKIVDGTRGRSNISRECVESSGKDEVI